jgi:hypothetical protein
MYNKPKIAREERFCKICTEVETEERVLISCHKYKDYSKHKLNSFKSSTSYTRNSQILHTTFVKNSDESLDSKR